MGNIWITSPGGSVYWKLSLLSRVHVERDYLSTRTTYAQLRLPRIPVQESRGDTMRNWDDDGVDGGPSSTEVLLEWLSTSGNATRWRRSAGKGKGLRAEMINEIYDMMLSYDIDHRSVGSIRGKLRKYENQVQEADNWLKSKGLRSYDVSRKTEDMVFQICPYYPEVKSLLQPKRLAPSRSMVSPHTYHHKNDSNVGVFSSSSDDDEELPKVGSKRGGMGGPHAFHQDKSIKRARVQEKLHEIKLEKAKCVALLEPEPDERREFSKLELQVKRDEAIIVRAKARKELLEMGVPLIDIDRVLPFQKV